MIKVIFQKRAILLVSVITILVTTAVASGYFVMKNEKKNAGKQLEALQKSIEELQANSAESAKKEDDKGVSRELEEVSATQETGSHLTPVIKKDPVVVPIALEKVKEKTVPCLTYADTTIEVTEDECEMIKQKNKRSESIDEEYQSCISVCESVYRASVPVTSEGQYDSVFGIGAYDSKVSECRDEKDECSQDCLKTRNSQIKKLWK